MRIWDYPGHVWLTANFPMTPRLQFECAMDGRTFTYTELLQRALELAGRLGPAFFPRKVGAFRVVGKGTQYYEHPTHITTLSMWGYSAQGLLRCRVVLRSVNERVTEGRIFFQNAPYKHFRIFWGGGNPIMGRLVLTRTPPFPRCVERSLWLVASSFLATALGLHIPPNLTGARGGRFLIPVHPTKHFFCRKGEKKVVQKSLCGGVWRGPKLDTIFSAN